jgi:hypothetical protein
MDDSTRRIGEADPDVPEEVEDRIVEIRTEIVQTRDELGETIEAIQERLSPSNIVATAKESVKNAASEKVNQMANTAGAVTDRVMHNTFMDTIRENPVPAAMVGIGLGWLMLKAKDSNRYGGNGGYYGEDYDRTSLYGEQYDWRRRTAPSSYRYEQPSTATANDTMGNLGEIASNAASRVSDTADQVRYAARRTTRRAQISFDRVMRENPLALGAAAILVGAAIGATIPSTDTEDEVMGEARDTVVDRARGMARDAAERVQDAAEQVKDVAGRTADAAKPKTEGQRPAGSI